MVLNTNQPFSLVQKKSKKQIVLSKLKGKTGCELRQEQVMDKGDGQKVVKNRVCPPNN